jgi:guanidinobutyrase
MTKVYQDEDCWYKSLKPLMKELREQIGKGPVYLCFDIVGLDPSSAPGTGTPEIGELTTIQGIEITRGCIGLEPVGCDLVEFSPHYDLTGNAALLAAIMLYDMLCVLPGVWN